MKKRVLLLILVMVLSLGVTAFCENADNTGTVASKQEEAEALPKIIALKPVINEQLWILGLRDKMSEATFELTNYISVDKELLSQLSFVIENEDELETVYSLEGDGRADEEGKVRLKFTPSQYGETVFKIKAILSDTKEYAEFELRIMVTDSVSVWAGSIGLAISVIAYVLIKAQFLSEIYIDLNVGSRHLEGVSTVSVLKFCGSYGNRIICGCSLTKLICYCFSTDSFN